MVLNYATAEPVSHILLIDEGTPDRVRELGRNARLVSDCYRELLSQDVNRLMELKYQVIFAVPEESSLATYCEEVDTELKSAGINSYVARIKAEDLLLWKGIVGLLSCVHWCISGTVLLNEIPITIDMAERLLIQANRLHRTANHLVLFKKDLFRLDYRMGLVRSDSSIGYLLRGFNGNLHEGHTVSDVLRFMKANCSRKDLYVAR